MVSIKEDDVFFLEKLFPKNIKEIWLEIGFGSGENIKWQLDNRKDIAIIGCEPYINGVANLLQLLDNEQLHRVKIFTGDAIKIINSLKNNSISRVFILFPDPWPKKRHHKRRLINQNLILNLSRVMIERGELIIASDHNNYISWILHQFLNNKNLIWMAKSKKDFLIKPENWPITRFEERAKQLGSICYFFLFHNLNKNH
ncbi:MAG: tRNA (guanosine(46)-N7)-methyltransferase TrmB [Pelagibacterales bacterium]|nr:tRNA (guanosine(46)-N7)-methyltransferase TrmB [Pelagibacterales bacterium]